MQPVKPEVNKPYFETHTHRFHSIGCHGRDPEDTCPQDPPEDGIGKVNHDATWSGKRKADVTAHLEESDHGDEGDMT